MVLTIVGLGLFDERDITLRGLEAVKEADYVYLETYTAMLMVGKEKLEEFYGKTIQEADRCKVEQDCDELLETAKHSRVAFLVVGDPFCATTHADLVLRGKTQGVEVRVIHNASIMNAVAACGLQLYRFGETVTIPFFEESWKPDSFYEKIEINQKAGCHSLCLLEAEKSMNPLGEGTQKHELENLCIAIGFYSKYMSIGQAIDQLFEIEEKRKGKVFTKSVRAFGMARVGAESQHIVAGTLEELREVDFGAPLHSLVICAPVIHPMEEEFFNLYNKAVRD